MKKTILILTLALWSFASYAAGGNEWCQKKAFTPDIANKASLQRGAKTFVNYCMSCHSAGYQRYSQLARDLDLTWEQVEENLIFTTQEDGEPTKMGEHMKVPMTESYAKSAFGTVPTNLSLIARVRGPDWIYNYLQSFYLDESRPFGVNNACFKDVSMPHVLWDLQGWQLAEWDSKADENYPDDRSKDTPYIAKLLPVVEDQQNAQKYDATVKDLVNFMVYLSDPGKLKRQDIGFWVIMFLIVLAIVTYYLKKEYWRDVH